MSEYRKHKVQNLYEAGFREVLVCGAYEVEARDARIADLEAALGQQQEAVPVGVVTQDVDEFIAESAYCTPIRDEYGDTHYETDTVDVDDLRAWMAGHVRVPVEVIESLRSHVFEGNVIRFGLRDTKASRRALADLLNASKGEL